MKLRPPGNWLPRPGIGIIASWLLLFVSLLKFPVTGEKAIQLEPWEGVLCYSVAHHLQWGVDIVFTYGPLGFLDANYYWGYVLWPTVLWGIWFALVMTLSLMRLARQIYAPVKASLLVALVLTPPVSHAVQDVLSVLAILVLTLECFPADRPPATRIVLTGMTLAVLSQIKFTFLLYSGIAFAVVCVAYLWRRRPQDAAIMGSSFIASFTATWVAAGQHVLNLPEYLRKSWQIASGYPDAMNLDCGASILGIGVLIALIIAAVICVNWFPLRRNLETTLRALSLVAAALLMWKESFIRADIHVVSWFLFAIFLTPLIPVLLHSVSSQKRGLPVFIVVVVASVAGLLIKIPNYIAETTSEVVARMEDALSLVVPPFYEELVNDDLASRRVQSELPVIRQMVGTSTVGILNVGQDTGIYMNLNYMPHPIFQDYSAYTPELQRLNSDFFNSSRAPDYLLWDYYQSDYHYCTLNYGTLMLLIPRLYTPIFKEGNFILWQRKREAMPLRIEFTGQDLSARFGDPISVGDTPCWLQIRVHPTWLGELRSLFYHPANFFLNVKCRNSTVILSFHLASQNTSYGFLLQPCILEPDDLLQFAHNGTTQNTIQAFQVSTDNPACFQSEIQYRMSTVTISQ